MTNNNKNSIHYDIIVLGDGSGGTLAKKLAQFDFSTALIGHGRPGGTCLNRGCIPSKKLIAPIFKLHSAIQTIQKYEPEFDMKVSDKIIFTTLKKEVLKEITNDSLSSKQNMEDGKIKNLTYYSSHTKFLDDSTLQLEDNTLLTFDKVVIATGSEPRVPKEIEGIENVEYDTSTEALFSQEEISSYTIIGGGVISSELGALYAACGIKVTMIATGTLLRPIDDMIKKNVEKYLENLGIKIIKRAKIDSIEEKNGSIVINYSQEKLTQTHIAPRILIALGVEPNTSNLGLENTSVEVNSRGFIETDENYRVNNNVFAIGDCSGKSMLRHGAGFEAREVFKQIIYETSNTLSQKYMPYGIYLGSSEIGGCGKTSQQLSKEEIEFKTYSKKFEDTVYGKAKGLKGVVLIHYHPQSLEIFGAHTFGPDGVNLNQIVVPYIEKHQTLYDLADTISPHPSLAEGLFTIGIRDIVYDTIQKTFN